MPKVIEQIQQNNDVAALKSICCDALSNIGSHVFERLEVSAVTVALVNLYLQINIILAQQTNSSDISTIRLYIRRRIGCTSSGNPSFSCIYYVSIFTRKCMFC